VGQVAYKLELPPESALHLVFHVSQLKKFVGSTDSVSSSLPSELTGVQVAEKVLQRRTVSHGVCSVPHVLIQWSSSIFIGHMGRF
jgi:hypothetical protein